MRSRLRPLYGPFLLNAAWIVCDLYRRGDTWAMRASNRCSIAAIVLLCLGLWRLVNRMGMFTSLHYGYHKLWEIIRMKDYSHSKSLYATLSDYAAAHPYQKRYWPYLVLAALDTVLALLLA